MAESEWFDRGHSMFTERAARRKARVLSVQNPHVEYRAAPTGLYWTVECRKRPIEPLALVSVADVGGADVSYYALLNLDTDLVHRLVGLRKALNEARERRPDSAIDGLLAEPGDLYWFNRDDNRNLNLDVLDGVWSSGSWYVLPEWPEVTTFGVDDDHLQVHPNGVWWIAGVGDHYIHVETPALEFDELDKLLRGESNVFPVPDEEG